MGTHFGVRQVIAVLAATFDDGLSGHIHNQMDKTAPSSCIIPGAEVPGILCVSDFSWVVEVVEVMREREREKEGERERDACDIDRYQAKIASDHA